MLNYKIGRSLYLFSFQSNGVNICQHASSWLESHGPVWYASWKVDQSLLLILYDYAIFCEYLPVEIDFHVQYKAVYSHGEAQHKQRWSNGGWWWWIAGWMPSLQYETPGPSGFRSHSIRCRVDQGRFNIRSEDRFMSFHNASTVESNLRLFYWNNRPCFWTASELLLTCFWTASELLPNPLNPSRCQGAWGAFFIFQEFWGYEPRLAPQDAPVPLKNASTIAFQDLCGGENKQLGSSQFGTSSG